MNQLVSNTNHSGYRSIQNIDYSYHLVLYILAFCDFYISVGSFSIKLFYVVSIPCLLLSAINLFKKRLTRIDVFFLMWIFASVFALKVTLSVEDVLACIVGELVLFLLYKDVQTFCARYNISANKALNFISKAILAFCLYGLFQYLLYKVFGINIGVSHLTMFPRPRSVFSEPDWLGMYACVGSSLFLMKIISRSDKSKFNWFGFLICFAVLLLSFTRAAWVSFAFGVIVLLFVTKRENRKRLIRLIFLGVAALALLLAALSLVNASYIESFLNRLNPLKWLSNDGGASDSRRSSIEIMWYYIKMNPIFGNGSGSMNYISSNTELLSSMGYYYEINAGRGNANVLIATLFDVGIVGFVVFMCLIVFLYKKCLRLRKSKIPQLSYLGIVFVVIFWNFAIDFQFNNGIRFSTVWLFFGLAVYFSDKHAAQWCLAPFYANRKGTLERLVAR